MDWSYHKKTGCRPSVRSDRLQPRVRQVPLKSLATLLMLAQLQLAEKSGPGLVSAAEVGEQQSIDQQLEVEEQLEEGLTQQQQLEQQLKQAQALEQKLRARLRARDAEADGLEDNDYAINSIEEFVDSDQLEEAGHSGNRPAEEISSKHNVVPVSQSKAQNKKAGGAKPKSLSLKKLGAAQGNHGKPKQARAHPQNHLKKASVGKKTGGTASPAPKSPPKHHEGPKGGQKQSAATAKKKSQPVAGHDEHQHQKKQPATQAGGPRAHHEAPKKPSLAATTSKKGALGQAKSHHTQQKSKSVEKKQPQSLLQHSSASPKAGTTLHHAPAARHQTAPKATSSPKAEQNKQHQQQQIHSAKPAAEHKKATAPQGEAQRKHQKKPIKKNQFQELPASDGEDGQTAANAMVMQASQQIEPQMATSSILGLTKAADTKHKQQQEGLSSDELKNKAIEATLASIKAKTKSITAQTGLQSHQTQKKEVSAQHPPKSQQQHSVTEKQAKKDQNSHGSASGKPQQAPKQSMMQQSSRSALDLETEAASQLSADALEYSAQTLESTAQDKESMELPAALREVEVIQPKPEAPKEQKKEQKLAKKPSVPEKKKDAPKKEIQKEQKKKEASAAPAMNHQTPPKMASKQPKHEKSPPKVEASQMKVTAPKPAKSPAKPHPTQHSMSKPMEQLKNKVNELTQPVISQLQKEKAAKAKMLHEHKQQVSSKPEHKQVSKVEHKQVSKPEHKQESKPEHKKAAKPEHAKPVAAPQQPKAEAKTFQSKEKYSLAEKASQAAKQAREKAENLEKQKIAMQAKAADLGSQHDALKEKQDHKRLEQKAAKSQPAPAKPSQMDLITQAIKHQKELTAAQGPSPSSHAPAPKHTPAAQVSEEADVPKPPEPQSLADANDILSALGQDPLQQALTHQEIKPEQNMIRIEDSTQESTEKPAALKKDSAPSKMAEAPSALKEKSTNSQGKSSKDGAQTKPEQVPEATPASDSKKADFKISPGTKISIQQISNSKTDEELQMKLDALAVQEKQEKQQQQAAAAAAMKEEAPKESSPDMPLAKSSPAYDLSPLDLPAGALDSQSSLASSVQQLAAQDQVAAALATPVMAAEPVKPATAPALVPQTPPAPPVSTPKSPAASPSDLIKKLTQQAIANQKHSSKQPGEDSQTHSTSSPAAPSPAPAPVPSPTTKPQAPKAPSPPPTKSKKDSGVEQRPKQSLMQHAAPPAKPTIESAKPASPAHAISPTTAAPSQEDIIKQVLAKAQKQKKEDEQQTTRSAVKSASQGVMDSGSEGAPFGSPAAPLDLDALSRVGMPSQTQGAEASVKSEEPLPKEKSEDVMAKILMDKDALAEAEGAEAKSTAPQAGQEAAEQEKQKSLAVQSVLNSLKKSQSAAQVTKEERPAMEKPSVKAKETPKNEDLVGAMALPSPPKAEAPKMSVAELPKLLGADGDLDSLPKAAKPEVPKPAAKPQGTAPAESLEELMQKFAESDGSQDDQALTDKIIKQVEASDREEARTKGTKAQQPSLPAPQAAPKPVSALEPPKKQPVEKPKLPAPVQQKPKPKEVAPKPAALPPKPSKPSNDPKEAKKTVSRRGPTQAMPQVKDDNKYGEDELKALDGFEKDFAGHHDGGPLDPHKLESEIKPAIKDLKPTIKDIKTATRTAQKASTKAQPAQKQAQAPKKPVLAKTAAKPAPHQQVTKLAAQPAKPKPQALKVSKEAPPRPKARPQPLPKPKLKPLPQKKPAPAHTEQPAKLLAPPVKPAAAPTRGPESDIRHSSFLGQKNQLEQQLDEKIRRKLEEEESGDADDDEKRITREIHQVMAQDEGKTEAKKEEPKKEEAPKKEEPPKEEPKKEEPKKAEAPAKEEKKEEKKEKPAAPPAPPPPPPPKKEEKKPAGDADLLDPTLGDYYYDEDPYFVHRRAPPRAPRSSRRTHTHYIDEDILESLNQDELMHRLLQDLHIHDEHSSKRAVEYLEQHFQKDSLALKDLLKKAKDLQKASSQIKKTQDAMSTERSKIHKLLEQLIEKMNKERTNREKKAEKKLRQLEEEDAQRRAEEQKELMAQEELARAIVEQEYQKHAKADEIAERYVELKKKDERVQNTLKAVKAEAERVKRDLALSKRRAQEAKEAEKKWQEKETERLGKDKDSLLEKYLRSRSEHEAQLRDLEHTMKWRNRKPSFRKLGQMARVSADSFGDDRYDSPYDPGFSHPRMGHPHRPHPDFYDDHHDLLDDDLPLDTFDAHPLMDKIRHLKRLQGQGECPEEPTPRYSRGPLHKGLGDGYGAGSAHPFGDANDLPPPPSSGDSGKPSGTKAHRKRPPKDTDDSAGTAGKDEGDKKEDSGELDFGLDHNSHEDDSEYDFGRVRGLSNQIEHVAKLRRLPPFKDLRAKRSRVTSLPSHDLQDSDQQLLAQKHERGDASIELQQDQTGDEKAPQTQEATQRMSKIDDLMKQVKSLSIGQAAEPNQQPAGKNI